VAPQRQQLRPDPGGQFTSDAHRRVAGNLSVPRNLEQLRDVLREDPHFPELVPGELERIVADLQADGHLKSLGEHEDADALVKAIAKDKAVPTLHKEKAEHFVLRTKRRGLRRPPHVVAGEQLYFTNGGLDTLEAPVPDEPPPLEGPALEVAEEQDEALLTETEERVAKDIARLREQHKAGLDQIGEDA
jgi:hypothetical protein